MMAMPYRTAKFKLANINFYNGEYLIPANISGIDRGRALYELDLHVDRWRWATEVPILHVQVELVLM